MSLIPLIDRTGTVRAWAERVTGWLCNPTNNVFLLIAFDGVFRFTGEQVGWFYGDHIRSRNGQVVLALPKREHRGAYNAAPKEDPAATQNTYADGPSSGASGATAAL